MVVGKSPGVTGNFGLGVAAALKIHSVSHALAQSKEDMSSMHIMDCIVCDVVWFLTDINKSATEIQY